MDENAASNLGCESRKEVSRRLLLEESLSADRSRRLRTESSPLEPRRVLLGEESE